MLFVEALLVTVRLPVAAPVAVGSNCKLREAVCAGFNVSGKLAPDTVKPVPEMLAALTVIGAEPVEESVRD